MYILGAIAILGALAYIILRGKKPKKPRAVKAEGKNNAILITWRY